MKKLFFLLFCLPAVIFCQTADTIQEKKIILNNKEYTAYQIEYRFENVYEKFWELKVYRNQYNNLLSYLKFLDDRANTQFSNVKSPLICSNPILDADSFENWDIEWDNEYNKSYFKNFMLYDGTIENGYHSYKNDELKFIEFSKPAKCKHELEKNYTTVHSHIFIQNILNNNSEDYISVNVFSSNPSFSIAGYDKVNPNSDFLSRIECENNNECYKIIEIKISYIDNLYPLDVRRGLFCNEKTRYSHKNRSIAIDQNFIDLNIDYELDIICKFNDFFNCEELAFYRSYNQNDNKNYKNASMLDITMGVQIGGGLMIGDYRNEVIIEGSLNENEDIDNVIRQTKVDSLV